MNLLTTLLSFIVPQKIEDVKSEINGKITVELYFGSYRISVDGFWQSGKYAANLLVKAIKGSKNKPAQIKNILLLGLGGGSVVAEINNLIPNAKIKGVDKDKLGISYSNLEVPGLISLGNSGKLEIFSPIRGETLLNGEALYFEDKVVRIGDFTKKAAGCSNLDFGGYQTIIVNGGNLYIDCNKSMVCKLKNHYILFIINLNSFVSDQPKKN